MYRHRTADPRYDDGDRGYGDEYEAYGERWREQQRQPAQPAWQDSAAMFFQKRQQAEPDTAASHLSYGK